MKKSIYSEQHDAIRHHLMAERKKAGLTQSDVAEKAGRPQSFVAKYEGGERRLDIVEFLELANIIGFDALDLLKTLK